MAEKEIDIKHLSPVEAIRTRPGMFIGGTENPNVILREAIDNAVDESFGCSTCNKIIINSPKTPEDYYMVADNGRGIPIIMDESGITKTKLAVTTINTGSKFKKTLDTVSVGLNGVGITACNSLSESFMEISKITEKNFDKSIPDVQDLWYSMKHGDEGFYVIEFNRGIEVLETAMTYDQICEKYKVEFPHGMSTIVLFRPDPQIFDSVVASYSPANLQYLQAVHKLFYKKDVHIIIDGKEPADDFNPYQFSFMKYIEIPSDKLDEDGNRIMKKAQFYVNFECDKDMAISEMSGSINSLVVNSGLHLNVVRNAYRNALKRYYNISHDYLMAGAKINVICMAGEVDFSSQTKERCVKIDGLTEWEMRPLLEDEFKKVFRANNDYFENHVTRLNEYAASLNKISTINKIKSMVTVAADAGNRVRSRIPAEVKDCLSSDRKSCELYLCFTGDTEILDCNNNHIRFDELANRIKSDESIYTFSCDERGSVYPSKITECRVSKKVTRLVKVKLDNGTEFSCTPDHKIMLKSGKYVEAQNLKTGDSCMPLYIKEVESDDYSGSKRRVIKCYPGNYNFRDNYIPKDDEGRLEFWVYRIMSLHPDISDKSTGKDITNIHHIDNNPLNDNPTNLCRVDQKWHRAHHGGLGLLKHYNDGEFNNFYGCDENKRKSISLGGQHRWNNENSYIEKEKYSRMAKAQWNDPALKEWKAKDNARWCKEHPEEAAERTRKAVGTMILNYTNDVINYINEKKLNKYYSTFDEVMQLIHPEHPFTIWTALNRTNLVNDYFDDYSYWTKQECIKVLEVLKSRSMQVTKQNYSDIHKELTGKSVRWDSYNEVHAKFNDLFSQYEYELNDNHKIESIEFIDCRPTPVYCLTVDSQYHNFPLANGIFAHNCEGRSAGGSILKARDNKTQAVIELKGIPMNSVGADLDAILANKEMATIISAIGVGVNEYFVESAIRYGKIIIAADSDADGFKIASLISGFFAKKITDLIRLGYIYILDSPLYKQGDQYIYNDEVEKLDKSKPFTRFKGLGELSPDQAKEVLTGPGRRLIQLTEENIDDALDLLSSTWARKQLMTSNNIIIDKYNTGIL